MLGRGFLHIIGSAPGAEALPARAAAGSAAPGPVPPDPLGSGGTSLTALPATSSIIYTASLTVRTTDLTRAAAQATQLARAAGGYVSSENTQLDRAHPDRSTVSLQLKIPVGAYQATLGALSAQLGTRLAMSQHAQDVTQTVADVTSRVTSDAGGDQPAARPAAPRGLGQQPAHRAEPDQRRGVRLESLLARQRALTHETSFGTVDLLLVASRHAGPPARHNHPGGFIAGLKAGWHGLVRAVSVLLTGAGAALPFAVIAAILAYPAYRTRRWYQNRRATPAGTTPPDPTPQP